MSVKSSNINDQLVQATGKRMRFVKRKDRVSHISLHPKVTQTEYQYCGIAS